MLDNILEKKNNASITKVLLSNGPLLQLDNEQSKQNLSWSEFSFVDSNVVDDDTAPITADFLCHHVVKKWPFYLSNFIIIKKLVVVFLMSDAWWCW